MEPDVPVDTRVSGGRVLPALVVTQFLSATGGQMTWFAISWFVLATTGSPARASVVIVAPMVAILLVGVHSGRWVMRWGPRRTLLTCDAARVPLLASVPVLHHLDLLTFPLLVALMFLVGIFFAPYYTAQRELIAQVAGADETRLGSSNSLLQAAVQIPSLLGPGVAGVLVALAGPVDVLFVESVALLLTLTAVAVLTRGYGANSVVEQTTGTLAGVSGIVRDRLLRALSVGGAAAEITFQVLVVALQVMVLTRYGGNPRVAGVLTGTWGGGVLAGTIIAAVLARRVPAARMTLWGALFGLPLWLLPVELPIVAVAVALAASGLFHGLALGPRTVVRSTRAGDHLRAQVIAADITATMGAGMLGLLVGGIVLDHAGLAPVLVGVAVIATLGGIPVLIESRR
ncbi:MFS transporter [Actinokineospora enzanensis]|uniref:MFS transporter n=1 Tax=Actinokineospora enzanensis TaxID=155975 RepID=UPI00036EF30B|nr:MFS transporter [Actinokineospora enzanensis]